MKLALSFMLLYAWLVCVTPYKIQKVPGNTCKTRQDCSKDECCAFLKTKGVKVCKKMRLSGEICNAYEIPGLPEICLCQKGLTCTPMSSDNTVHRCVKIPDSPREYEEEHHHPY